MNNKGDDEMRIDLNGKWQLKGTSPQGEAIEITAQVPGCALNAVLESEKDFENDKPPFCEDV